MNKIDILSKLHQILNNKNIITNETHQKPYNTDWRGRYSSHALAVAFPETNQQISEIIKLCQTEQIALIPQGGNTSTCGASVPHKDVKAPQIIINLRHLREEITLDKDNMSMTVSAGYTLSEVQQLATKHGLYFPLSIASEGSAQIGGLCATNAGGIHVIKYGCMRNLIMGIEAITPDGAIISQLNTLRKNNTNFDLKQLFIGSEGTLGIITKVVLKLFPKPYEYTTFLCGVNNIQQAITLLRTLQNKLDICAYEIINTNTQQIHNTYFSPIPIVNNWLILCEIESQTELDLEILYTILENHNIDLQQTIIATNSANKNKLWQYREQIPLAEKMAGTAIKHDIALPISQIPIFLNECKSELIAHYPQCNIIIFGHLGDGNLHYNVQFIEQNNQYTPEVEHKINQIVYNNVYKYSGTFSAEHGIGQLKCAWYALYNDKYSYNLAKQIKQLIDPQNIFNPGKIWSITHENI